MSRGKAPTLREVLGALEAEKLSDSGTAGRFEKAVDELYGKPAKTNPWFLRVLVGTGAWVASLFLIGFIFATGMAKSGGAWAFMGIIFIAGAIFLRKIGEEGGDFFSQLSLAGSLCGQGMVIIGTGMVTDSGEAGALCGIILAILMPWLYPETVQRFMSGILFAGSISVLTSLLKVPQSHPISLLLAAGVGGWMLYQDRVSIDTNYANAFKPVGYGLVISAVVMLVADSFHLGWARFGVLTMILTVGLGLLALLLAWIIVRDMNGSREKPVAWFLPLAGIVVVCAMTTSAPGIIGAIGLLTLGFFRRDKVVMALGIACLGLFLSSYYYNMGLTLLQKSEILVLCGAVLLIARALSRGMLTGGRDGKS